MKIRRAVASAVVPAVFLFIATLVLAKQTSNHRTPPPATNTADASDNARLLSIESHLSAIERELGNSSDLQTQLSKIESNTNDLKGSEWLKILIPAILSTLSALAGLWLGNRWTGKLQQARLTQETTLAREKAKADIGNSVIEWELRQLSLLYGPIRALLGQSLGLYRQMSRVLVETRKNEFRLVQSSTSPDGWTLEIQTNPGQWDRFRTVLHISKVYGKEYGVDTYFDEIVRIGKSMVKIIKQQAGYARADEKDLMAVFAGYLAHFAVLSEVHKEAQDKLSKPQGGRADEIESSPMVVDLSAVFPEQIHGLINQGFEALTASVQEWRQKAVS